MTPYRSGRNPSLLHRAILLLGLTIACSACSTSGTATQHEVAGYELDRLDRSQSPCMDFYQFASGGWLASNPIPPDADEWGTIAQLIDTNKQQIRSLIESAASDSNANLEAARNVGDFYAACMDQSRIEELGTRPLADELQRIASIHDAGSLLEVIAALHSVGADVAFDVGSTQDPADARSIILVLSQGGLGLSEPGFYLEHDQRSEEIRDGYVRHVATLFELAGDTSHLARDHAAAAVAIEGHLAAAAMPRTERRDPSRTTHRMSGSDLRSMTPSVPWGSYFRALGIDEPATVNVEQPDFFRAFDLEVLRTPLEDWKQYLRWQLLRRAAPELGAAFADAHFEFYSSTLRGTASQEPRWKRCVRATDQALTGTVGYLYVREHFSAEDRAGATEMVNQIVSALRERVANATWLSQSTRRQALLKIDSLDRKVGYPDRFEDESGLWIDRRSHLANTFQASRFKLSRELERIGLPLDRNHWSMPPQVPNARYGAATNEIIIPAAVLQPPLWDRSHDSAFSYGAIGALIGHELTHALDDRGARYDAAGNLRDWWTPEDYEEFSRRADCIASQFDGYFVDDEVHLNGRLVQGESISDLGGLTAAFDAYAEATRGEPRRVIAGFTPEQRVFLGWARMWTANLRPELARRMALTNTHPTGRYRVNGTVSNMPEFATAFGCKAGDAMVATPSTRCFLW